jgi:hypothetical protein
MTVPAPRYAGIEFSHRSHRVNIVEKHVAVRMQHRTFPVRLCGVPNACVEDGACLSLGIESPVAKFHLRLAQDGT